MEALGGADLDGDKSFGFFGDDANGFKASWKDMYHGQREEFHDTKAKKVYHNKLAIDEVTVANGPIYFIKGSHQQGMLPTRPSGVKGNSIGMAEPPTVTLEHQFRATLEPGDATVHHCNTIHHSGVNKTDQPRLGLLFVFAGTHIRTNQKLKAAYTEAVTATPPA